ncbi:MAG: DUF4430 domain-containing protein [Dehalococcoidales bacterium]
MEIKKSTIVSLLFILAVVFNGCTGQLSSTPVTNSAAQSTQITAQLIVSENFGRNVIFDNEVIVREGTNCLELLSQKLDVKTAYGGGFVTSIQGIASGYLKRPVERKDWFLYINGILSNAGGLAYRIRDGDTIHWYYRDWSFRPSASAIISDFPSSLKYGYGGINVPLTIWYEVGWHNEAHELQQALIAMGIKKIFMCESSQITISEKQTHHLIVIGSDLFDPIREINDNWSRLGLFCRFNKDVLEIYDSNGNCIHEETSGTGLIYTIQNPFNPTGTGSCQNTCWVISGTDKDSISGALDTLMYNWQSFKYFTGAVVNAKGVQPLP